jgi:hypothetical protein
MNPMRNNPAILRIFLTRTGLLLLTARGTAMPIMKRNAGKIKSATVSPCHGG